MREGRKDGKMEGEEGRKGWKEGCQGMKEWKQGWEVRSERIMDGSKDGRE